MECIVMENAYKKENEFLKIQKKGFLIFSNQRHLEIFLDHVMSLKIFYLELAQNIIPQKLIKNGENFHFKHSVLLIIFMVSFSLKEHFLVYHIPKLLNFGIL
jgi:hypothetical protein